MHKVLILDGNQRSALAATRSLGKKDLFVVVSDSVGSTLGYDSRVVPNDCSLRLLENWRRHHSHILAFDGQDLHQIDRHSHVQIVVSCEKLRKDAIIEALRQGDFRISNHYFQVHAARRLERFRRSQIYLARRVYEMARAIRGLFGA